MVWTKQMARRSSRGKVPHKAALATKAARKALPSAAGGIKSLIGTIWAWWQYVQRECVSIVNTHCQTLTRKTTFTFLYLAASRDPEIPKVG